MTGGVIYIFTLDYMQRVQTDYFHGRGEVELDSVRCNVIQPLEYYNCLERAYIFQKKKCIQTNHQKVFDIFI